MCFYELPEHFSIEMLNSCKKSKIALYHPDKWSFESEERQKAMAKKYTMTIMYYEVLKAAIQLKNEIPEV